MKRFLFLTLLLTVLISEYHGQGITPIPDLNNETGAHEFAYYRNSGQLLASNGSFATSVRYYAINGQPLVFASDNMMSLVFQSTDTLEAIPDTMHRIDMKLVSETGMTSVHCGEKVPGGLNFYQGHTPLGVTGVEGFERLEYPSVYPNIDFQMYSNSKGQKWYHVIKPGGNPASIIMQFAGAVQMICKITGELEIISSVGSLEFKQARAYQISTTGQVIPLLWQPAYGDLGGGQIGFANLGSYDPALPLVFQMDQGFNSPTSQAVQNLKWSTMYGGFGYDEFMDAATDANGNVYFCGRTTSPNFPLAVGNFPTALIGGEDAIVVKLDSNIVPQWATYFGGDTNTCPAFASQDWPWAIALDNSGQPYIAGQSASTNIPIVGPPAAYQDSINDTAGTCYDGFIAHFDVNGMLVWSTYYGGDGLDYFRDITVDNNGNIYAVGKGDNSTHTQLKIGASNSSEGSSLIVRFNPDKSRNWAAVFGDAAPNFAGNINTVTTDGTNNVYFGGSDVGIIAALNTDPDFPSTQIGGGGYLAKMDTSNSFAWTMYITGGSGPSDIEINPQQDLYTTGVVTSNNFIFLESDTVSTSDFFKDTIDGAADIYILKVGSDADTADILWGTAYGSGSFTDAPEGLAIDDNGFVYIHGEAAPDPQTIEFPVTPPANTFIKTQPPDDSNLLDGFVVAFSNTHRLVWTTYYGTDINDKPRGIATWKDERLFIVGNTAMPNNSPSQQDSLPIVDFNTSSTSDYLQPINIGGNWDGYAAMFCLPPLHVPPVGIHEGINELANPLILYPVPTQNNLWLKYFASDNQDVSIRVYSVSGSLVLSRDKVRLNQGGHAISVASLGNGLYVLEIEENAKTTRTRFIVAR